ncbi:hypothetical protein F2Q68_00006345 [Brassica cretica]|uniref:Uncharacterized protein n=1 Tax=Brassica cretica TaxID=69181 RepID=A0A8S9JII8_BRACR|nr:hypothetical protein F2Q68_00006345 [Brassica cretica]
MATATRRDRATMTATRSSDNDGNEIERRQRDRTTATDQATAMRSSDGDKIKTRWSVFSLMKQTRSKLETSDCRILSKNHKL